MPVRTRWPTQFSGMMSHPGISFFRPTAPPHTPEPTAKPTSEPTAEPSLEPIAAPTSEPTVESSPTAPDDSLPEPTAMSSNNH